VPNLTTVAFLFNKFQMSLPSLQGARDNRPVTKDLDFEVDDQDLNDILGLVSSDDEVSAPKASRQRNKAYFMALVPFLTNFLSRKTIHRETKAQ
jgi:hypothetical protein